LGELYGIAIQKKQIRAGKGKLRGRKYKKNAGALLIIGNEENKKIQGIDILKTRELRVRDLADGGARVAIFTENAIKDLENIMEGNKK
jgi:large subunit ribosomal protein L4e